MKTKIFKICVVSAVLLSSAAVFAVDYRNVLWDDFFVLRDGVYNNAVDEQDLAILYEKAVDSANKNFSKDQLSVALSRCDYMIGRFYSYAGNKEEAEKCFDSGAQLAQKAMKEKASSVAALMYSENISQNCSIKNFSYVLKNGRKVGSFAQKALEMDPVCGAAMYILYAQYIYAPSPFNNLDKGISEMKAVLANPDVVLQKDDVFNLESSIGYAYIQLDNTAEAKTWLDKALEIYPENLYVKSLVSDLGRK